jgi:TolB-like protein/class 3 adenylate cyclase
MDKQHSITIDGWKIDSMSYRISRGGVEKKLEPRSMELLLYLVDRPDEVVTRQEIEDNVWQGRVVGYDALSSSIAKIRKAFDDTSKNHRVIETISKAGYRLIAPVLIEADAENSFAGELVGENFERKLTAIFYADVAGYSRLTGENEDRTHRQLRNNMKTISEAIVSFGGRIVHYAGDAVLADFSMASNALHCALDVQQKISEISSSLADNQRVLFRIGVNLGEVIVDGDEIYGDGVNVAARLESLAEPGGVCISGSVFDAIGQKQGFDFEYHGEKSVKNIERPVRTYEVHLKPGATIPVPDSLSRLRTHPGQAYKSRVFLAFVACLLVALVGLGFYIGSGFDESTITTDSSNLHYDPNTLSLAIVPFENMSNDPGQTVYADGLTDDLITDLSSIDGLQVTPRHSSFLFKNKNLPVQDIARQLQVRYVVQGSFRRSLGDVRVSVQLVDSQSDAQIWAGRFDEKIENVFKLQDQIVGQILEKINLQPDTKPKSRRRTTNLEAYDYFLRAEHRRLYNRGLAQSDETLRFYRRAIELDPSFVAAYTGLAREALTNWQLDASQVMPRPTSRRLVYDSASKALELDPENADALAILGLMQAISGAHDIGLASVKSAVAIDPANPQLHADLAEVLSYSGAHEEGLESINTAIDSHVTPPSVFFGERAKIYFFLGQFKKALSDLEKAEGTSVWENFTAFVYGALDDRESAGPYVDARLEVVPFENLQLYWVDFAYYSRPADIELLIDSAAKAGIPRFAYGFDPGKRQPLDGEAIAELIETGLWHGQTHDGNEIFQQFTGPTGVAMRTSGTMLSGSYFLKNDKLCVIFSDELPDCGYIYPGTIPNEFTWVTLGDVYQFSTEY